MYHFYLQKENGKFKIYGQFIGSKNDINKLKGYWNFLYPNRCIKSVK